MLEAMPGGQFHFDIAKIYRNAYIISSMLSNSEIWYGGTQQELERLKQVDQMFMRNLMECSYSVPKDLFYLELGVLPFKYKIQTRIFLFLHSVLQQNKESLVYTFYIAHTSNPNPRDWVSTALEYLVE